MSISKIALLSSIAGASALAYPPPFSGSGIGGRHLQLPLGWKTPFSSSEPENESFSCDLPPIIDPSGHDELPSADDLFSGDAALVKQVERHQAIVRVPSVSYDDLGEPGEDERWEVFHHLHETLASVFPNVHRRARLEKVNTLGLVYTFEGSDPSLKPTLLAAHQDVVPVADPSTWTHPPFAAVFDGEWLWGRGAGDDKNSLTALLSAVEALVSDDLNWQPRRTLILAFGFDEECSGPRGAGAIGRFLTERYGDDGIGVILDEGGLNMLPVHDAYDGDVLYALPAVLEKAHFDIYIELRVPGGHSSTPSPHTGIGIAAELIEAIEAHPFEPTLIPDSPTHRHLQCLARYSPRDSPDMTDAIRSGDLERATELLVESGRSSRFRITTAQAVDVVSGGAKINALPEVVTVGVNYRVAPQDSIPGVQRAFAQHIAPVVAKYGLKLSAYPGDDEYAAYVGDESPARVEHVGGSGSYNGSVLLEARDKSKGTPVAPASGPVWDTFAGTIRHSFAFDGLVVPVGEIMTGNTDTRHYVNLTPHIYRWSPAVAGAVLNIHTVDERVRMRDHVGMVKFYYDFVRNFDHADF